MAKTRRKQEDIEEAHEHSHDGGCCGGGEGCCGADDKGCCGGGWRGRWHHKHHHGCNHGGALYFLGAIGAAVFFFKTSVGFWGGVLAILKGLVWPAFLVHKAFSLLGF